MALYAYRTATPALPETRNLAGIGVAARGREAVA